jgi:hypothetical protein
MGIVGLWPVPEPSPPDGGGSSSRRCSAGLQPSAEGLALGFFCLPYRRSSRGSAGGSGLSAVGGFGAAGLAGGGCISAVGGAGAAGFATGTSNSIGVVTAACTAVELLSAAGTRWVSGGDAAGEPRGVSTADTADIAAVRPCSTPPKTPVGIVGDATGSVGVGAVGTAGKERGGTRGTAGRSASDVGDSVSELTPPSGGRGVLEPIGAGRRAGC